MSEHPTSAEDAISTTIPPLPVVAGGELVGVSDGNPALVYLATLSTAASRRTMRGALARIACMLGFGDYRRVPWHLLRYQHTSAIQATMSNGKGADELSPLTVRHRMAALRGVLTQAWKMGLMSAEDYQRAKATSPVQGTRLPPGRALSPDELARIFAQVEAPGIRNARDGAILALLCAGLRRFEVTLLDLSSFQDTEGRLRFIGKRNKERIVPLPPGSLRMVKRWLKYRGTEPGPLILPIDQRGRAAMRRCCENVVPNVIASIGDSAGVENFSAHDFRRTLISGLFDKNIDIVTIAKLVGHKSTNTTAEYDRRKEDAMARAVDTVDVPSRFWEEDEE